MLFIAFLISLVASLFLHPKVVAIARRSDITDKPNPRKLQRQPVPVLGGVVVFFGILMGIGLTAFFVPYYGFILYIALMLILLITGTLDDISGLSPGIRFAIEIGAALCLIFLGGIQTTNFYGLWGLHNIPFWVAVPVTIITVVGIINSINLIDGVDGLSSGYCIMACGVFAWYFSVSGNERMTALALASIGALVPFFIFNVFGTKSKMFIGDGGTLLMGMVLSIMTLCILTPGFTHPYFSEGEIFGRVSHGSVALKSLDGTYGIVPFLLAVFSFPICDTLRVMISRIIRHTSPFRPDKTHLHHALIDCGYTHIRTTGTILTLNAFIILLWNVLYQTGCSVNCQFYVIVGTTIVLNFAVYRFCRVKSEK